MLTEAEALAPSESGVTDDLLDGGDRSRLARDCLAWIVWTDDAFRLLTTLSFIPDPV